jgi:hypothetical protein
MSAPIIFSEIPRTSPTLWSHMRLCGLRAALASTPQADRWVLHDPRAWLGIAFHRVMEATRPGASSTNAELVWNTAVAQAAATASLRPLDSRFATPERWPSYFLVRQRALASASEIALQGGPRSNGRPAHSSSPEMARGPERLFEAREGRLAGRPDHFDGHILTAYKSALPDPAWPGAAELLNSFRRQVRLYAAIIADAAGTWPTHGRVVSASGHVLEVASDPAACDAEADAAVAALDALNRGLLSEALPERLAQPSQPACTECPFQTICPAFWRPLGADGMQGLPDVAIEGVLNGLESSQDGDLYTAHRVLSTASHQLNDQQPVVLRKSAHGDLSTLAPGTRWRIVSAKIRPDGRLRADLSTVVCTVSNLPSLVIAARMASHRTATSPDAV